MRKSIFSTFLIILFASYLAPIVAQETVEDPYADYSYLWEEKDKKKKKKKKKTTVDQPTVETTPLKAIPTDSLPTENQSLKVDSTKSEMQLPSDSLPTEEPVTPSTPIDSLETKEPQPVAQDTVRQEPEPQEIELPQDTTQQQEPEVKEKPKKEKKAKKERSNEPPAKDFRAGSTVQSGGSFDGGLTVTQIDGQYYAGLVLNPEFSIGKVGVGLNVPVLYGLNDNSIRTEIFEDGVGVARLVTYVRYGIQKQDPIYVKVGQLNNTMIGFGGLINNYTNSTSFEKRKVGLHYDVNYQGFVGIEGMYSDFTFGSANLFAIRPYVRPLVFTGIPIVKTLEIGSTIVRDGDQTAIPTSDSTSTSYLFTREAIGAFGIDAGITLLNIPFIQIDLFANYSRLNVSSTALTDSLAATYNATTNEPSTLADGFQAGSGASVGVNFRFNFIADLISTDVRIERLNYQDHYLPQFFDAIYEINKDARIFALGQAQSMSGFYGSLTGHILKKVELGGSLMIPDNITEATPATIRVHANLERLADKFSFHGSYIKGNLTDLGDAFKFDDRSLAKVRAIYHLNKFLAAGLDYYWAFTPTADGGFEATQYVSPYFGVSIAF